MLEKNNLKKIQSEIDRMVEAMKYVDESKLSTASIIMFANALDVITSLTSDLCQLCLWHIKKYGDADLDFLRNNVESLEKIPNGIEKLSEFMDRLSNEVNVRELLLK